MRPPDHMLSKGHPRQSVVCVVKNPNVSSVYAHLWGWWQVQTWVIKKANKQKIEMGFHLFCPGCPQIPVTMCFPLKQNAGQHLPRPL